MFKIENYILLFFIAFSSLLNAQTLDSLKINFSGFIESYYAFDFNKPTENKKLPFMYNYNRHNEFNINNALLRVNLSFENVYGSLAFHSGTYVEDNYAQEEIKFISEAIVGLYLDDKRIHSIEMGILPSYLGFESATSSSNLTLTRSLSAENSPYFMTGVKYQWKPSEYWSFATFLTNGWQRIKKLDNSTLPAFGSQIIYSPNSKTNINWNTFIGDEPTDLGLRTRYFSNFYLNYQFNNQWKFITGFDIGMQESSNDDSMKSWLSPTILAQYAFHSKWQSAFRTEYYQDQNNVIININNESFKTIGNSLNLDYLPNSKVKLRLEARWLQSKEPIFVKNDKWVKNDYFLTTSMSFEF